MSNPTTATNALPSTIAPTNAGEMMALSGARGRGQYALVSPQDHARLSRMRWFLGVNGYVIGNSVGESRVSVLMHRLVLDCPKGFEIDHVNGNPLDNRRVNLRIARRSQNNANARLHAHSRQPYKGIRLTAAGKWQARIRVNRQEIHLGNYSSPHAAAEAYDKAALANFGEYARPNFPVEVANQ